MINSFHFYFGNVIHVFMVSKIVINPGESNFIKEWEAKKAENAKLHTSASKRIKRMCVFAKNLITEK